MNELKNDPEIIDNIKANIRHEQKIIQFISTLSPGDAVSNEARVIKDILTKAGFSTEIYAEYIHPKLSGECSHYLDFPELNVNGKDILIYHFSTGCPNMVNIIKQTECRKIMIYHNITPGCFFEPYNMELKKLVDAGRKELNEIAGLFDYCLADSEYNVREIRKLGVDYPVEVMPLIIPFDDYDRGMNVRVLEKYCNDDWVNILFVGRITPNKKQEDVIRAFNYYKKNINPKSRLFLVGNPAGMETYYQRLRDYIDALELKDVIFPGHIGFDEVLSYYNIADVFLCMSEHEGFCVPLVEAMYFDIPIIAYREAAIPYVMSDCGAVVDNKDPKFIAEIVDNLIRDDAYREKIICGQRERLKLFTYERISSQFMRCINDFVKA